MSMELHIVGVSWSQGEAPPLQGPAPVSIRIVVAPNSTDAMRMVINKLKSSIPEPVRILSIGAANLADLFHDLPMNVHGDDTARLDAVRTRLEAVRISAKESEQGVTKVTYSWLESIMAL